MTSIIKSQLASYLERFVKGFQRDQLRLSITKGRFELKDLEFEEDVLTDLMELPTWLKIDKVTCNRLYVKIGWRKIQTQPLHVHLDELRVTVVTCPELRTPKPPVSLFPIPMPSLGSLPSMKYRLPHKVIDGTYMTINAIHIQFETQLMSANIQIMEVRSFASTPEWEKADIIAKSRVKNEDLDETLIFRQMDFASMKVELYGLGMAAREVQPIRVVSSAFNGRMIMKRRLSDATLICIKMDNLLDFIQMAMSETELKTTVDFIRNILRLSKASAAQTRARKAQSKYVVQEKGKQMLMDYLKKHIGDEYTEQLDKRPHFADVRARYFMRHDIWETSHHMVINKIDLTLVHDNDSPETLPEYRQQVRYADAAVRIGLNAVKLDIYPFHLESPGYNNWMNRRHMVPGSTQWISQLLAGYNRELGSLQDPRFAEDIKSLMSTTAVTSIGELTVSQLVSSKTHNQFGEIPLLSFSREQFAIPQNVPAIELVRTQYYFARDVSWPVPKTNLFASIAPMKLAVEAKTIDWLVLLGLHVAGDLVPQLGKLERYMWGAETPSTVGTLLRVEGYFPQIFLPKGTSDYRSRNTGVLIQGSSLVITNTSVGQTKMVADALPTLQKTNLYSHTKFFPNMQSDWSIPGILDYFASYSADPARRPSLISVEMNDLWAGVVRNFSSNETAVPFMDAFPLRMWIVPGSSEISKRKLIWGAAVLEMDTPAIRMQLNEYVLKTLSEVSTGLAALGKVTGEHLVLLNKLGLPELGLCLLMQQENIEMSFVLQPVESEVDIGPEVALAASNLDISKEASMSSSIGRTSALASSMSSIQSLGQNVDERFPLTSSSTSAPDQFWWRRGRAAQDSDSETEDVEESESGIGEMESEKEGAAVDTGYATDDENDDWVPQNVPENDSDTASLSQFSWTGVGADRRRIPLEDIPTKLMSLTLKSLQVFSLTAHGHMLAKLRLGKILTSETQEVPLSQVANLPVQDLDGDVFLPEHLDSILLRFENGEYSARGNSPTLMSAVRGLKLSFGADSIRRLVTVFGSGAQTVQPASNIPTGGELVEPPKDILKWAAVPLIDVRLVNTQLKLKDVIEPIAGGVQMSSQARDLALRVRGLRIRSSEDGVISVGTLGDEDLADEEVTSNLDQMTLEKQISVLNSQKAKLDMRISDLHSRLASRSPGA